MKGVMSMKVKVPFQDLHMTHVILCWFIIYNFVFQVPHSTLHFRYKYSLTTN
jgi:hypothetical protein